MANQERSTGTVLWFNNMKGYGFIKPSDGGEDLFVHQSSIISDGFRSLAEGEEVEFSIVTESDGKSSAIEVTGIDGSSLKGASREGFGRGWKGGDRFSAGGGGDGCYICGEVGHLARDCNRGKNTAAAGGGGGSGACFNCGGIGHMARDCNRASGNGRAGGGGGGGGVCFNCGGFGHMARDCNNRGSTGGGSGAGGGACYNCGGFGHLARDCTSRSGGGGGGGAKFGGSGKCFNCGEMGHFARECTKTS